MSVVENRSIRTLGERSRLGSDRMRLSGGRTLEPHRRWNREFYRLIYSSRLPLKRSVLNQLWMESVDRNRMLVKILPC